MNNNTKYILSISGGGIKGIIPALFLYELYKRTGKQPREIFDFFIGTSTGGIMALLLNSPKNFTVEEVVKFYVGEDAKKIFKQRNFKLPWDAVKYPSNQVEEVLFNKMEEYLLKDCINPVTVTTYDMVSRNSLFINSYGNQFKDLKMWECARSTSAAPTYFAPFKLKDMCNCDGGLFANNPTFFGYIEAKKYFNSNDNLVIISIGTGSSATSLSYEKLIKWNILDWAANLFNIFNDGQSDTTTYAMNKLLENTKDKYISFDLKLPENCDEMDNVTDKYLNALIDIAKKEIKGNWNIKINELLSIIKF